MLPESSRDTQAPRGPHLSGNGDGGDQGRNLSTDAGLAALVLIARYHGIAADPVQIRHAMAVKRNAFNESELLLAARSLGLKARVVPMAAKRLANTPFPALVLNGAGRHFILAGCDGPTALVLQPEAPAPAVKAVDEVVARSNGRVMLFASRASLSGELARFDFSWFVPAIVKYRRLLLEVLGCRWCCNCSPWFRR